MNSERRNLDRCIDFGLNKISNTLFQSNILKRKTAAGINRWKFPDVVSVNWNVDLIDEQGHFDADMADVMRGLGEQRFMITSTELKVAVTSSSLRSDFFQCVSNSKWAHNAQLAIATEVTDEVLSDELKRLGASYGVTIVSFGLNASALMPSLLQANC